MSIHTTLCQHCRLPIGRRRHVGYVNDVNGLTFKFHADALRDCWLEVHEKIAHEYMRLVSRISRKEDEYATLYSSSYRSRSTALRPHRAR